MIVLRTGASDGCSLIRLIPVDIKKAIFLNLSAVFETIYNSIINVLAVVVINPKHDFMITKKHVYNFVYMYI